MCDDVSCYGMTCEAFEKDLLRCDDLLARLDPTWRRKKFRWFRPPRGYLNEEMLEPLNRLGYRVALCVDQPVCRWHDRPGSIER